MKITLGRLSDSARREGDLRSARAGSRSVDVFAARGEGSDDTETLRRRRVLQMLYRRHAVETSGAEEAIAYPNHLPPLEWINAGLASQGEMWRIADATGMRCRMIELT